jgi:hypothetical protein
VPAFTGATSEERTLFDRFAPGVAYVDVQDRAGDRHIGTCFHIGNDVFITARHVVEDREILSIATSNAGVRNVGGGWGVADFPPERAKTIEGPYFHPKPEYDLAALRLPGMNAAQIPLLPLVDDRFENKLLLRMVVVMGFPPIPGSRSPVLVCARAEVNASFRTYFDKQQVYIVSSLARGGFSGGPALTPPHHCLGVITRAMVKEEHPEELGFMAVVPPMPILQLLDHNNIMPGYLRTEIWEPYMKLKNGGTPPSYFV